MTVHRSDTELQIIQRLKYLCSGRRIRQVSREVGVGYERLRRCLHEGARPALEVVLCICRAYDGSLHWVLTGDGAPYQSELHRYYLMEVPPQELVAAFNRFLSKSEVTMRRPSIEVRARRHGPSPQALPTQETVAPSRMGVGSQRNHIHPSKDSREYLLDSDRPRDTSPSSGWRCESPSSSSPNGIDRHG